MSNPGGVSGDQTQGKDLTDEPSLLASSTYVPPPSIAVLPSPSTLKSQGFQRPPVLVGLSGPSSSGKTTIARHLRNLLPLNTLILHEDDFYRPEEDLPLRAGHRDWDCAGAIDLKAFTAALTYIRKRGCLPPDLNSKEDRNDVGPNPVDEAQIKKMKVEMHHWLQKEHPDLIEESRKDACNETALAQVVIVDGFLLFGRSVAEVRAAFDLRLFLRTSFASAKARREGRTGYVTLEGFWEDPPGYVDDVVWPGYVEEHAFLFKSGDVDGDVDQSVTDELDIRVCPGQGDMEMHEMLEWVVNELKAAIERKTQN